MLLLNCHLRLVARGSPLGETTYKIHSDSKGELGDAQARLSNSTGKVSEMQGA